MLLSGMVRVSLLMAGKWGTGTEAPRASSSALCRGSAADARDKPEHDEREVSSLNGRRSARCDRRLGFSSPSTGTDASALPRARPLR
ncbi:hypothetical protein E0H32_10645 [Rhizobium leguminosarum bv. viciae]|nr:hypothetical protein E0H32_10645 [Rhizobium leguminosarum bv. viciae]